jgi:hypothetical protein
MEEPKKKLHAGNPNASPVSPYDWDALKEDWLSRNLDPEREHALYTLKAFADEHKIPYNTMRLRAGKERWYDQLHLAKVQSADKALDELTSRAGFDEYQFRLAHMRTAELMQKKGLEKLLAANISDLSVQDAINLMRYGVDIERKALGMEQGQASVFINNMNMGGAFDWQKEADRIDKLAEVIDVIEADTVDE